jgi:hypothetical protein
MADPTLPVLAKDTADANLPATYQAAQRALAECEAGRRVQGLGR